MLWLLLVIAVYLIAGLVLYVEKNVVAQGVVRWWTVVAWPYVLAVGKYPKGK